MHNFFRKLFITLIRAGDQFNWKSRHLKEFSKLAFVNMAQANSIFSSTSSFRPAAYYRLTSTRTFF